MNNKRLVSLTICFILYGVLGITIHTCTANESSADPNAEQHFEKANEFYKIADYHAAITEYKAVISLSPKNAIAQNAQYWIGQIYFETRRFDDALSTFQELVDEFPSSVVIPTTKAMIERVQKAKKNKSLFEAVKKADIEQVKSLIAEGADVDAKWRDIYNEKWPDIDNENVRENLSLLRKKWRDERTPLWYAVDSGKIELVMLLVEAGADVNAGGWAPLGKAVDKNNTAIAEYLIDHGANVNVDIIPGWGFLQEIVKFSNSIEMAKLLIARGADINSKIYPVLHNSIRHKRRDLIELLFQHGADVNAKDTKGWTPLYYAVNFHDDTEFINILITNGVEVNIKNSGGETLLQFAAIRGKTEAVKLLLEAGAKVDEKDDESGFTALHHGARFGKKNVAELLVAKGADINAKDKQGHTPLYVAVNHDYKVAELLINKGADSGIRTESGRTLLELAQQRKQAESTIPDMIFDGEPNSKLGIRIGCGDVDGDGYDDIFIGAGSEEEYNDYRGRVYLLYGGPDMDTTADLIFEGQNEGDWFGNSIVCGDIDNDGYEDIFITASGFGGGRSCAYLYWGSDRNSMDANPDKIFAGEGEEGSQFMLGGAAVYDIDNDGYDDIILPEFRRSNRLEGQAYLYYGNTKELMDTSADLTFPRDQFRGPIRCGDVDNDGYGDIVVGSARPGRAYLYYGDSKSNMDAKADVTFEVKSEGNDYFGADIVCVDQNRDGYDDVVIGARGYNKRQGRAYLFNGDSKRSLDTDPDMIFDGEVEDSYYGVRAISGDIDGDNVNDIVIGAYNYGQLTGRLYVYWGKELSAPDPKPGRILTGEHPKDGFGYGLACGDVNNDGFDDLVIGAYGYKAGTYQGRAYLYYGGPKNE